MSAWYQKIIPLFVPLFFFVPLAHATMYAPGETLDPDCGPTDPDCGVTTSVSAGTEGQVPYYASDGSTLSATSTITILSNGSVGIGTSDPVSALDIQYSATKTADEATVMVLKSNEDYGDEGDPNNPQVLEFSALGAETQANRTFFLQTSEYNNGFGGNLALQPYGGNVGIGTTTPSVPLTVYADSYAALFGNNTGAVLLGAGADFGLIQAVGGTFSESLSPLALQPYGDNVGIGTTTPQAQFHLYNGDDNAEMWLQGTEGGVVRFLTLDGEESAAFRADGDFGTIRFDTEGQSNFYFTSDGELQVINENDYGSQKGGRLTVQGTGTSYVAYLSHDGTGDSPDFVVSNTGNVGIASSTPWRTLSVDGTAAFSGLTGATGAGSICLSSTYELVYNASSDNCLSSLRDTKHDIEELSLSGTTAIEALTPVSFVYNNDPSEIVRYGFIAEDAAAVDSHLGTYDQNGDLSGVDDRSLIAITVKALKEIAATIASYAESFTTRVLHTETLHTAELCVEKTDGSEVCLTGDEVSTMLDQSGQSQIIITDVPVSASQADEPAADDTPPEESPVEDQTVEAPVESQEDTEPPPADVATPAEPTTPTPEESL